MAVETRYTYQNHHHKHQFVDGEELTALQQPGGSKSGQKVSQVININHGYTKYLFKCIQE